MSRMTSAQEHQALRERVDKVDEKLDRVLDEMQQLRRDMAAEAAETAVRRAETKAAIEKVASEVAETKEIVSAWKAVKVWGTFVKWAAGIGAALLGLVAAWKGFTK